MLPSTEDHPPGGGPLHLKSPSYVSAKSAPRLCSPRKENAHPIAFSEWHRGPPHGQPLFGARRPTKSWNFEMHFPLGLPATEKCTAPEPRTPAAAHVPLVSPARMVHFPEAQSPLTVQPESTPHFFGHVPPQSMSLSSPFFVPSVQDVAEKCAEGSKVGRSALPLCEHSALLHHLRCTSPPPETEIQKKSPWKTKTQAPSPHRPRKRKPLSFAPTTAPSQRKIGFVWLRTA